MKGFLVLLFVAVATAQDLASQAPPDDGNLGPCKEAYDACRSVWLVASKSATDVATKCRNAEDWTVCLAVAVEDGKCLGDEGIPQQLAEAEETYCAGAFDDDCQYALQDCKSAWEKDSATSSDKCSAARQWYTCAEESVATGHCDAIPGEVDDAVRDNCAGSTDNTCLQLVAGCQATWTSQYSSGHPNSVKCMLANTWSDCFNLHMRSPACISGSSPSYPRDLAVQLAYCSLPDEQDDCKASENLCEDAWSSQLNANSVFEQCQAARSWRDCLSDPTVEAACPNGVTVPMIVDELLSGVCLEQQETLSCADQQARCAEQYQNPVAGKDRCEQVRAWKSCLIDVEANGCDVVRPLALENAKRDYCKDYSAPESCPVRIAQCGATFDQLDPAADRCQQARQWRQCLVDLFGVCDNVVFPRSLDEMEAYACYSPASSCLNKQTACKSSYQDKIKQTGNSCEYVKEWRSCLEALVAKDNCDLPFPQELDIATVDNCYKRPGTTKCGEEQAKCMKTFDDAESGASGNTCQNARTWRSCLERLMMTCNVIFPMKLNMAEAMSCYGPQPNNPVAQPQVQVQGTDAGGAPMSCTDREDACKKNNVLIGSGSVNRCDQAKNWRACLEGLMVECTVSFPQELDKLQAFNCGQTQTNANQQPPQPPKDVSSDNTNVNKENEVNTNSCAYRAKKCRPSKPTACRHATAWRSCLDKIKDECGMGIYTMELNVLTTNAC